jgi:type I restriction enzyme S subunit
LYFLLSSDDFFGYCVQTSKGAKMPRGDKQAILRYEVPIPSIEVQKRVVKVLTAFEKLTQDLEVGLPAEIAARQSQYEYYRSKLLTFKELDVA